MNQGANSLIQRSAACFVGYNTFYALQNTIFVYEWQKVAYNRYRFFN